MHKGRNKPDKRVPVKSSNVLSTAAQFIQSFYTDPFKWQLTKSTAVFVVGVYLARDIASVKLFENA